MNIRRKRQSKAFSLIEIILVIIVIAILFVVFTSRSDNTTNSAKIAGVKTDFRAFYTALKQVGLEDQIYTLSEDEFEKRLNGYLDPQLQFKDGISNMQDPWGKEYIYNVVVENKTSYVMFASQGHDSDEVILTLDEVVKAASNEAKIHLTVKQIGTIFQGVDTENEEDTTAVNNLKANIANRLQFIDEEHTLVTEAEVPATCTETGLSRKTYCSDCGKVLREATEIPALGHEYETISDGSTCTSDGIVVSTCKRCDHSFTTTVPAKGHVEVKDSAIAPSCEKDGKSEGSHCAKCNAVIVTSTVVPATGHSMTTGKVISPTCTKDGSDGGSKCTKCSFRIKAEIISALGHIDADSDRKCDRCGESSTPDSYSITLKYNDNVTPDKTIQILDVSELPTPTRAGYEFAGWYNNSALSGTPVTGISGDATYYAKWTVKTDTKYTVKHLLQDIDGTGLGSTYTLKDTEVLYGTTDTSVTPAVKTYEGFTSPSTQTVNIDGNGNRVVEYKYARNQHILDVNGALDGSVNSSIVKGGKLTGLGTVDVYINNIQVADDVDDYCIKHPYGSTYEIKDIKAQTGYTYDKVVAGNLSGTLIEPFNTYENGQLVKAVRLNFTTNSYYLDINFYLDDDRVGDIKAQGIGTYDLYLNDEKVSDDRGDYCTELPYGTTYKITDIKTSEGYIYSGSSTVEGFVGEEIWVEPGGDYREMTRVFLDFESKDYNLYLHETDVLKERGYEFDDLIFTDSTSEPLIKNREYLTDNGNTTLKLILNGSTNRLYAWFSADQVGNLEENEYYTYSFDIKGDPGRTYGIRHEQDSADLNVTTTDNWKTVTHTFKATKGVYKPTGKYHQALCISAAGINDGEILEIKNLKIYKSEQIIFTTKDSIVLPAEGTEGTHSKGGYNFDFVVKETIPLPIPTKEGHTFLGWYDNENFIGEPITEISKGSTGDKHLYAKWEVNKYTLDMNIILDSTGHSNAWTNPCCTVDIYIDGVLVKDDVAGYYQEHPYGTTYEFKDFKVKDGYTYEGLVNGEMSGTITKHTELRFDFTTNQYNLYLHNDIGVPESKGYSFDEYQFGTLDRSADNQTTVQLNMKYEYLSDSTAKEGKVLKAIHPASQMDGYSGFYFHKDTVGGLIPGETYNWSVTLKGTEGKRLHLLGHDQGEWLDITLNGEWQTFEHSIVAKDKTIQAFVFYSPDGWNEGEVLYVKDFYLYPGSTINYTVKDEVTLPTPTKEGYDFLGWYDNENFTGEPITSMQVGTTGNKHLYAKWQQQGYDITLDYNNQFDQNRVVRAKTYSDLPTPTREGYEFLGWKKSFPVGDFTEDCAVGVTLTKVDDNSWKFSAHSDDIEGCYYLEEFTLTEQSTLSFDWNLTEENDEDRDTVYCDFYVSDGKTIQLINTSVPQNNYTHVSTVLQPGNYYSYLKLYGGEIGFLTSKIELNIKNLQVVSEAPQTFTEDMTLTAQWQKIPEITLNYNDGVTANQTVTTTKLSDLPTPTREGYVFDGWYTISEQEILIDDFTNTLDNYQWVKQSDGSWESGMPWYKYEISTIVSDTFTISNPSTLSFNYRFKDVGMGGVGQFIYTIFDQNGQEVYTESITHSMLNHGTNTFNVSKELSAGTYYLEFSFYIYGTPEPSFGDIPPNNGGIILKDICYTDQVLGTEAPLIFTEDVTLIAQWAPALQGKWRFNENIPISSPISQNINFTMYDGTLCDEIRYNVTSLIYRKDGTIVRPVCSEDLNTGNLIWSDYSQHSIIDFGEEPQAVSEEFYAWFTANSKPVETFTFTVNGTLLYAEKDMTWYDWIYSSYNTIGIISDGGCPLGPAHEQLLQSGSIKPISTTTVKIVENGSYYLNQGSMSG